MINGNVNDFLNKLYYGEELEFIYNNKKYFIEGIYEPGLPKEVQNIDLGYERKKYTLCLFYTESDLKENLPYIWVLSLEDRYPVQEFLNAKIFDGKSFWDVEQEIEWIE